MQRISMAVLGAMLAAGYQLPAAAAPANSFNPKISLVLNGAYAHYSNSTDATVPGVLLGDEGGFAPAGFALGESELAIESDVDDQFHAWTSISFANENGSTVTSVEEAYIDTLSLPAGLSAKFGRFFSDIGYLNRQHAHAWDFVDAPLVYRAFFNGQLGDDGLQLRWLAPTDLFMEFGAEALRGGAFPAGGDQRTGAEAWTAFAHFGGDVGTGGSWRTGLWHYTGNSQHRETGDPTVTQFTGDTRINGIDFIYKWAPNGNPMVHNFTFQTELMRRSESGQLVYDPTGSADSSAYDGTQIGGYVQAIYQFIPRWRAGVRYDRLSTNNTVINPAANTSLALLADDGTDPQRWSAMLDFSNSEFSRLRLQFNRDQTRPGRAIDNQVFVQYVFALGSHPAHQF